MDKKRLNSEDKWANEWADAFESAERKPSDKVWQGIDAALSDQEKSEGHTSAIVSGNHKDSELVSSFEEAEVKPPAHIWGRIDASLTEQEKVEEINNGNKHSEGKTEIQTGAWAAAFAEAEVSPSEKVWENIDATLAEQEKVNSNSSGAEQAGWAAVFEEAEVKPSLGLWDKIDASLTEQGVGVDGPVNIQSIGKGGDNSWAAALELAEIAPSERVWQGIDARLATEEAKKYRRRAFIYKWVAAAAILFACITSLQLVLNNNKVLVNGPDVAIQEKVDKIKEQNNKANTGHSSTITEGKDALQQQGSTTTSTAQEYGIVETGGTKAGNSGKNNEGSAPANVPAGFGEVAGENKGVRPSRQNSNVIAGVESSEFARGANSGIENGIRKGSEEDLIVGEKNGLHKAEMKSGLAANNIAPAPVYGFTPNENIPYIDRNKGKVVSQFPDRHSGSTKNPWDVFTEHTRNDGLVGNSSGIATNDVQKDVALAQNNTMPIPQFLISDIEKKGMKEGDLEKIEREIVKVWVASDFIVKEDQKDQKDNKKLWLGASLATTNFKPNFDNVSLGSFEQAKLKGGGNARWRHSTANMEDWTDKEESQSSYNVGINAMVWLGKRLVVQSGVSYGNYKFESKAGSFIDPKTKQAYPLHFSNYSDQTIEKTYTSSRSITSTYDVVNSFNFVSIPLKVGFLVLDKKLGIMVSPGVSSEFFLQNRISDTGGQLSTYTVYNGDASPYHRVYLNGSFGAQFFYKLGANYLISVEPTYYQAITDFSKSGSSFESRPTNFGVGAGFKYIIH